MMKEKYESLSAAELKAVAKARGLKHLSGLKKSEVVARMLEADEKEKAEKENSEKEKAEVTVDAGVCSGKQCKACYRSLSA